MSVKILITRTIPPDKTKDVLNLIRKMRSLATAQDGYISGETLKSRDRRDVYLVISTWESEDYWEKSTTYWVVKRPTNCYFIIYEYDGHRNNSMWFHVLLNNKMLANDLLEEAIQDFLKKHGTNRKK